MRRTIVSIALLFAILCPGISMASKGGDGKRVVAVVGSESLTLEELNRMWEELPTQMKGSMRKEDLVNRWIDIQLLWLEAKRKGIEKDKAFKRRLEEARRQIAAEELIRKEIVEKVVVSEDEIRKYYEENRSSFVEPERIRVRHIMTSTEEKAKEALEKLKAGGDFGQIARQYSEDPGSRDMGGDLGFIQRGELIKEFEDVAFKLGVGELSPVVRTQFGYHIIKVEEKVEQHQKGLEEVREEIRSRLLLEKQREAFDEMMKSLREKTKVKVEKDLIGG
jgi:peptidyl-prolyl cis-trans isomerase C